MPPKKRRKSEEATAGAEQCSAGGALRTAVAIAKGAHFVVRALWHGARVLGAALAAGTQREAPERRRPVLHGGKAGAPAPSEDTPKGVKRPAPSAEISPVKIPKVTTTSTVGSSSSWWSPGATASASSSLPRPPKASSFAASNYKRLYAEAKAHDEDLSQHLLFAALKEFLDGYAFDHKLEPSLAKGFFQKLQAQMITATKKGDLADCSKTPSLAVRLWTSALLGPYRKEFCSLLNACIRSDADGRGLRGAAKLSRFMNLLIVKRGDVAFKWPARNVTYRGTGIPRAHLDFFAVGKTYRAPMFVATSYQEKVAQGFLERVPKELTPVLFLFRLDAEEKCVHALFINGSLVKREKELLYTAYSAFRVIKMTMPEGKPSSTNPVRIEVAVAHDNKAVSEYVPLAEWH